MVVVMARGGWVRVVVVARVGERWGMVGRVMWLDTAAVVLVGSGWVIGVPTGARQRVGGSGGYGDGGIRRVGGNGGTRCGGVRRIGGFVGQGGNGGRVEVGEADGLRGSATGAKPHFGDDAQGRIVV